MVSVYVSVEIMLEEFERITTLSLSAETNDAPPSMKHMATRAMRYGLFCSYQAYCAPPIY
jgi:hypothetical protein